MGKRKKSSRGPVKKKNDPLPETFNCLFCNHEKCVQVKVHKKEGFGSLECKVCAQKYQTSVNYLSLPVDVYADWVDAAELAANNGTGPALGSLEDPRARMTTRKDRDEDEAEGSDGGDPENPRYAGSDIVGDDVED